MNSRVYNRLWWAYLIDMFDFTFFGFNVLPEFAACILLIGVLNDMKQEEPNIANLYLFVYVLLAADIGSIVLGFIDIQMFSLIPLTIITTAMNLYLWYVLFTTAAQISERQELKAGRKLYTLRNWSAALQLGMYLLMAYLMQSTMLIWAVLIAQLILIVRFRMIVSDIDHEIYVYKSATALADICTDETGHLEIIKPE